MTAVKEWFLQEFSQRFSFLCIDMGFDPPQAFDEGYRIVFPKRRIAVVFSLDVRESTVSCSLNKYNPDSGISLPRVALERILVELKVIPPSFERKQTSEVQIYDSKVVNLLKMHSQLWKRAWYSREAYIPEKQQQILDQMLKQELDYYEYVFRTHGSAVVAWFEKYVNSFGE